MIFGNSIIFVLVLILATNFIVSTIETVVVFIGLYKTYCSKKKIGKEKSKNQKVEPEKAKSPRIDYCKKSINESQIYLKDLTNDEEKINQGEQEAKSLPFDVSRR